MSMSASNLAIIASGSGGGGGGGEEAAKKAYQEDCVTLLRAAIDLRDRTGALPSKQLAPELLQAVRGALHADLSDKNVFNRFRTLRANLKKGSGNGGRLVQKLSAQLWNWNQKEKNHAEEEEEMEEDDGKSKKAPVMSECGPESLTYLIAALEDEGYSAAILNKENLEAAKVLNEKLKKYFRKVAKYDSDCQRFKIGVLKLVKKTLDAPS